MDGTKPYLFANTVNDRTVVGNLSGLYGDLHRCICINLRVNVHSGARYPTALLSAATDA